MLTVMLALTIASLVLTLLHAIRPPMPLWPGVLMLVVIELLRSLPLGR